MTQQAQLIEAVLQAPADRADAILQAATGSDKPRMGTAREAAAILGACVRTVERYARQGAFPRVHLSPRKVRYDLTAVERFARVGR
ncbi:MAG: helix-turn-helix domain-containing protein [Kiritimatiellae bacterium]|nr:helix-turn-helix domain-containing protein [Kiritimatiellia bacterium]